MMISSCLTAANNQISLEHAARIMSLVLPVVRAYFDAMLSVLTTILAFRRDDMRFLSAAMRLRA